MNKKLEKFFSYLLLTAVISLLVVPTTKAAEWDPDKDFLEKIPDNVRALNLTYLIPDPSKYVLQDIGDLSERAVFLMLTKGIFQIDSNTHFYFSDLRDRDRMRGRIENPNYFNNNKVIFSVDKNELIELVNKVPAGDGGNVLFTVRNGGRVHNFINAVNLGLQGRMNERAPYWVPRLIQDRETTYERMFLKSVGSMFELTAGQFTTVNEFVVPNNKMKPFSLGWLGIVPSGPVIFRIQSLKDPLLVYEADVVNVGSFPQEFLANISEEVVGQKVSLAISGNSTVYFVPPPKILGAKIFNFFKNLFGPRACTDDELKEWINWLVDFEADSLSKMNDKNRTAVMDMLVKIRTGGCPPGGKEAREAKQKRLEKEMKEILK